MTARVDLPPPEHAATCARYLADCLRRNQAEQALVVLYPPKNGLRHSSVRPVHATLTQHFHRVGIELVETLCVGERRQLRVCCDAVHNAKAGENSCGGEQGRWMSCVRFQGIE